jgi:hypothetical protein
MSTISAPSDTLVPTVRLISSITASIFPWYRLSPS